MLVQQVEKGTKRYQKRKKKDFFFSKKQDFGCLLRCIGVSQVISNELCWGCLGHIPRAIPPYNVAAQSPHIAGSIYIGGW